MSSGPTINSSFYCPITGELMEDPVIGKDGITYERTAIERWIHLKGSSPSTRQRMTIAELVPNRTLRAAIEEMKARGGTTMPQSIEAISSQSIQLSLADSPCRLNLNYCPLSSCTYDRFTSSGSGSEYMVHASALSPDVANVVHVPTDLVLILDVSVSTSISAISQNDSTSVASELRDLTVLDLISHATKTIVQTMKECDRLAVVAFSNQAIVISDFLVMSDSGKRILTLQLRDLVSDGMTNLWAGINSGLTLIENLNNHNNNHNNGLNRGTRNRAMFILTDGEPNIEPPRGTLEMLKKYRSKHGSFGCVINTFGFGYQLDSVLLRNIAKEGNGMYSFIPDCGMIGTVFVNALANTLVTVKKNISFSIEPLHDSIKVLPWQSTLERNATTTTTTTTTTGKALTISVGTLQMGQSKDVCFLLKVPALYQGPLLKVTLEQTVKRDPTTTTTTGTGTGTTTVITIASSCVYELSQMKLNVALVTSHLIRSQSVLLLQQIFDLMKANKQTDALRAVSGHIVNIDSFIQQQQQQSNDDADLVIVDDDVNDNDNVSDNNNNSLASILERMKGLQADFGGQVREALSKEEYFQRWGRHYLPSLQRAHELQQCNNFKDPGVQSYGGNIFNDVRDNADDLFCSLPPPTPSTATTTASSLRLTPSAWETQQQQQQQQRDALTKGKNIVFRISFIEQLYWCNLSQIDAERPCLLILSSD